MVAKRGRGEGSIYKRKDGRWTAEISTGITPLLESIEIYHVLKSPPKIYWFPRKSLVVSPFSCQLSCQDSERETCVN